MHNNATRVIIIYISVLYLLINEFTVYTFNSMAPLDISKEMKNVLRLINLCNRHIQLAHFAVLATVYSWPQWAINSSSPSRVDRLRKATKFKATLWLFCDALAVEFSSIWLAADFDADRFSCQNNRQQRLLQLKQRSAEWQASTTYQKEDKNCDDQRCHREAGQTEMHGHHAAVHPSVPCQAS